MSNNTITAVRTPVVTIPVEPEGKRPSVRRDLEAAAVTLAVKKARVEKYTRRPAKNVLGEPLPMPLRFTIALNTAQRKYDKALTAYEARYGSVRAKAVVSAATAG